MRRSSRPLRAFALAAAGGLVLAGTTQLTTTAVARAADSAQESVIVVLADQIADAPPTKAASGTRRDRATAAQDAVLNKLTGAKPSKIEHFSLGNAFSATVTAAQATQLAQDPAVASVLPDSKVTLPEPATKPAEGAAPKANAPAAAQAPNAICPTDAAKPLLEPEALTSIHAASTDGSKSAADLADGSGVKVAFLADNMDPNYPDSIRPDGSKDFADYQDFSGDGPNTTESGAEAFGDASSIAAQGVVVHDLSRFVNENHPLPAGCNIVVKGVAPGASLLGLNVFGSTATNSAILQAIDYAVTVDHVDVLNESLGLNQYPDASSRELFQVFNDQAVAAGVTVTASSGDAGITSTIGSPATDPLVISTGATTADTHKFESRYLDRLIGPYPQAREVHVARSPIHRAAEFGRPLLVLQGADDPVAPPDRSELIVDALRSRQLPVAYLLFEGEQHGFRRAENIRRALEAELSFYSQILGFELPAGEGIEPVEVENLGSSR